MVNAQTIQELLNKQPFHPFLVTMNDGNQVSVDDPDLAFISVLELNLYAPPPEGETIPHHLQKIIAVANITAIEIHPQAA